jgi:hypothetical protein
LGISTTAESGSEREASLPKTALKPKAEKA